jgi:protocatechuate 3,4-dioxygenase alpha subunit
MTKHAELTDSIASQTIGPFFHNGLKWTASNQATAAVETTMTTMFGVVRDGNREPIADCMLEFWMVGSDGKFATTTSPERWLGCF